MFPDRTSPETTIGINQKSLVATCPFSVTDLHRVRTHTNPKAHSLAHDLTQLTAAQYLVFASLLARRVEEAHLVKSEITANAAKTSSPTLRTAVSYSLHPSGDLAAFAHGEPLLYPPWILFQVEIDWIIGPRSLENYLHI